LQRWNRREI